MLVNTIHTIESMPKISNSLWVTLFVIVLVIVLEMLPESWKQVNTLSKPIVAVLLLTIAISVIARI